MKNALYEEGEYLPFTAPYDRLAGQGMLVGSFFGVVVDSVTAGNQVALSSEGVYQLDKSTGTGTGGAPGQLAYWDNTAKAITAVATGNTKVGCFFLTAADADVSAAVKLNGTV